MTLRIDHLYRHPQHLPATAQLIYHEFWVGVRGGMSVADLEAHLAGCVDPRRIPLSLVALDDSKLVGTINLIDNDDDRRRHLWPWLAALVVAAERRRHGIGTLLVRRLLDEARQIRLPRVYFGTDGPGFYQRLGACLHEQVRADFSIMRFDLDAAAADAPRARLTVQSNQALRQAFAGQDDAAWLRALAARRRPAPLELPRLPSTELQIAMHGSAQRRALAEAGRFIGEVRRHAAQAGRPIDESTVLLDFGCGWGRMLLPLLKDCRAEHLFGVDVRGAVIDTAIALNPYARFAQIDAAPPAPFADGFFDVIVAYSVFSHLNEELSRRWIAEFARILKPGGLLALTTQGQAFLCQIERLQARPWSWRIRRGVARLLGRVPNEAWERSLLRAFPDPGHARRTWAAGEFVHRGTGGDSLDDRCYGETLIPRPYVEKQWTAALDLVAYVDRPAVLPQALVVMRRPAIGERRAARSSAP